jgi:hypothetical protein
MLETVARRHRRRSTMDTGAPRRGLPQPQKWNFRKVTHSRYMRLMQSRVSPRFMRTTRLDKLHRYWQGVVSTTGLFGPGPQ